MLPLKKLDSTVVCSTHTYESTVIKESITKLWPLVRGVNLDKLLPSSVSKVAWLEGGPGQVGSRVEVTWTDSAVWRLNITEISDINHFVSYELVEAEPPLGTSSLQAKIHLLRVSDENHTFVSWETDFPNDANAHIIQDNKYKKLEFFAELKKNFNH